MNLRRILIAVSHPPMGLYLSDIARSLGFQPCLAHGWHEAVVLAQRGEHPIVLLDERLLPSDAGTPQQALKGERRELAVILLEAPFPVKRTRPGPEWVLRNPDRPTAIRDVLNSAMASLAPVQA